MKKFKKIVFLSLCLFILTMMFTVNSYAAEASISATSVTEGENVKVTVTFPEGTFGYEGTIQVVLFDGTVLSGETESVFGKEFKTATVIANVKSPITTA